MSAGAIDHEAGTRHIHRLGGLATLMPIIATLSFIAAAAMAGIPLSSGFLSKEMMLEEASHTAYLGLGWLFPVLATAAALLSASYSFRFAIRTFLGPARHDYPHPPHDPPVGLWLPACGTGSADRRDRRRAGNDRRRRSSSPPRGRWSAARCHRSSRRYGMVSRLRR